MIREFIALKTMLFACAFSALTLTTACVEVAEQSSDLGEQSSDLTGYCFRRECYLMNGAEICELEYGPCGGGDPGDGDGDGCNETDDDDDAPDTCQDLLPRWEW